MRSKIGTQSRLAAHILALFLLILLLVYLAPPSLPAPETAAEQKVEAAAEPETEPVPEPEPKPKEEPEPAPEVVPEAAAVIGQIAPRMLPPVQPLSLRPPAEAVAEAPEAKEPEVPADPAPAVSEESAEPATPEIPEEPVAAEVSEVIEKPEPPPAAPTEEKPVEAEQEELPVQAQPDESGALVVAPADAGAAERVTAPLRNARLEVLGDGVYWLAPGHDLTEELAAIPELARLIILAPLPGYTMSGLGSVEPEVLSAALPDCTPESAERFARLAAEGARPVVAAALPGARGAAFFKAAYLLKVRNLSEEETLREIEADLAEAGDAREEVLRGLSLLLAPPEEPEPAEETVEETVEEPVEAEEPAANDTNEINEANDTGGN